MNGYLIMPSTMAEIVAGQQSSVHGRRRNSEKATDSLRSLGQLEACMLIYIYGVDHAIIAS